MRKRYLDNIRWITIILVVIFHIFFYYNNIGTEPMFAGAAAYNGKITFAGIFQYFVHPWFMLLLFVVAGMSAKYALQSRTNKEFLRGRVDKLLVPSTLGVLAFGWVGGYVIYLHTASANILAETPAFVKLIIIWSSGIGALWFCHVLFLATLILILVRKIVSKFSGNKEKTGNRFPLWILFVLMYFILWGGSHILNMPLITAYRLGIYIPAFLFGYYVFSREDVIEKLKKNVLPLLVLAVAAGIYYISRSYGKNYTEVSVLSRWDLNLYAFLMVLLVLGAGARFLDWHNAFTDYMQRSSFGIYVFHIPVMLVINYLLVDKNLPMGAVYGIEFCGALAGSLLLYEVVRRIPVLRYWILGIRKAR